MTDIQEPSQTTEIIEHPESAKIQSLELEIIEHPECSMIQSLEVECLAVEPSQTTEIIEHPEWAMIQSLEMEYLGVKSHCPHWDVLILAPPLREKNGVVYVTEWTQANIQESAKWGLILDIGDRAFEIARMKGLPPPYKPGDWVRFSDFCPNGTRSNDVLTYLIPDGKILRNMGHLIQYEDLYDDIKAGLEKLKEQAKERIERIELRKSTEQYF